MVILFFETEEDMRKGGKALDQMDAGETPGTRVDLCEVKVEMDVS